MRLKRRGAAIHSYCFRVCAVITMVIAVALTGCGSEEERQEPQVSAAERCGYRGELAQVYGHKCRGVRALIDQFRRRGHSHAVLTVVNAR